jgi:hypothetical protein
MIALLLVLLLVGGATVAAAVPITDDPTDQICVDSFCYPVGFHFIPTTIRPPITVAPPETLFTIVDNTLVFAMPPPVQEAIALTPDPPDAPVATPESATLLLLGSTLIGLGWWRAQRTRRAT